MSPTNLKAGDVIEYHEKSRRHTEVVRIKIAEAPQLITFDDGTSLWYVNGTRWIKTKGKWSGNGGLHHFATDDFIGVQRDRADRN